MGIFIGGYDPLKLIEGILNKLVQKGVLSREEAQQIVDNSKAPVTFGGTKNEESKE